MTYIYLVISILSEVIATSFLKKADGFTRIIPSCISISGYICAFYFLSLTLKTLQLGIVYAIWSGVGIVLIVISGYVLYDQRIDTPGLAGIACILVGVLIINLFSKSSLQ